MNYGWRFMALYRRQGSRPCHKKEMQKGKWFSEKTIQIAEKRREATGKGEKKRYTHLNAEFQRIDTALMAERYSTLSPLVA